MAMIQLHGATDIFFIQNQIKKHQIIQSNQMRMRKIPEIYQGRDKKDGIINKTPVSTNHTADGIFLLSKISQLPIIDFTIGMMTVSKIQIQSDTIITQCMMIGSVGMMTLSRTQRFNSVKIAIKRKKYPRKPGNERNL